MTTSALDDQALYSDEYFLQHYAVDIQRAAMYRQEKARIIRHLSRKNAGPAGGWILDYGCGKGDFLACFDDQWKKYGVEPSEFAWRHALDKGIVICGDTGSVSSDFFDVVVFRGTLQHIGRPMEALAEATRILKRGGLLVVLATPDTDSLVYKIFGDLPALEAPRNWVLFGNRFLLNILCRLGYEDISTVRPYLGTPYARPAGDFFKFFISLFLGYRKFAFPGNMMEVYAWKK
jgi:SAM-dependent methyltransferase